MSLLDSFYKKYTIMNETTVDDPEGGWVTGWTPGATVEMALDDPTPVKLGTYLRRVGDETAVYLVQSKPVSAPGPAGIQVMKADVIETRLPT